MKIITCASYYGVGSSAVTDLVAEYDCVKDLSSFEFRFLHDIDGVRDLEYYLVDNHNRHNAGHALKRFMKLSHFNEGNFMSSRYSQFFDKDEYHRITENYINALTDFKFKGWWFYDLYDKGPKVYYLYQILNHLFRRIPIDGLRILKNEYTYCSHPNAQKFLQATQQYIHELMCSLNKEGKDYLEIDQIVPSTMIDEYTKYFLDEIYVFVVDRDPRDIYFSNKYYWKECVVPRDGVEAFCKWFRYTRDAGNGYPKETDHIKRLRFEDLIYHYDETVKYIEEVTGLESTEHVRKFEKLNPLKSVINTQVYKRHKTESDLRELEIIERMLPEYIYNFGLVSTNDVVGIPIADKKVF